MYGMITNGWVILKGTWRPFNEYRKGRKDHYWVLVGKKWARVKRTEIRRVPGMITIEQNDLEGAK